MIATLFAEDNMLEMLQHQGGQKVSPMNQMCVKYRIDDLCSYDSFRSLPTAALLFFILIGINFINP
jgi:hypothetical protein